MRALILFLAVSVSASLCIPSVSFAQSGSVEAVSSETSERAQLVRQLKAMETAFETQDVDQMVNALAPPLMRSETGKGLGFEGEDLAAFDDMLVKSTKSLLSMAEFTAFFIDYDAIRHTKNADGAPLAFIPTSLSMELQGQTYNSSGDYVALQRKGEWIVLSPTDENAARNLKRVFPELADETLVPMSLELLK